MDFTPEQLKQLMREAIREEREAERRELQEVADRRLHNTELLLRNYKYLKAHAENAVYEAEEVESAQDILQDLMLGRNSVTVESIKRSAARTVVIMNHVDRMLNAYEAICLNSSRDTDPRKWDAIYSKYIREPQLSVAEIARNHGVVEQVIYDDLRDAKTFLGVLFFGIDGVPDRRKKKGKRP